MSAMAAPLQPMHVACQLQLAEEPTDCRACAGGSGSRWCSAGLPCWLPRLAYSVWAADPQPALPPHRAIANHTTIGNWTNMVRTHLSLSYEDKSLLLFYTGVALLCRNRP